MSKCKCNHETSFTDAQFNDAIEKAGNYAVAEDAPCPGDVIGKLFFHPEKLTEADRYIAAGAIMAGAKLANERRNGGPPPEIEMIRALGEALGFDVKVERVDSPEDLLRSVLSKVEPKNKTVH